MAKALKPDQYLSFVRDLWDCRWDYSKTSYVNMLTPLTIICREHGEFQQMPQAHKQGKVGCPGCRWGIWDTSSFVEAAQKAHGTLFDYSKSNYTRASEKVTITCPFHGDFTQLPGEHVSATHGCAKCAGLGITTEEVVNKFKGRWGDTFDYTDVAYKGWDTKVRIICREHGPFQQVPASHLRGHQGCPECLGKVHDTSSFVRVSTLNNPGPWDYSKSEYTGNQNPITIVCQIHGDYSTVADYHVQGYTTCPKCMQGNSSKLEKEVAAFVRGEVGSDKVETNCRQVISPLELDIFIPELLLAIEVNGLYWHTETKVGQTYHQDKYLACKEQGVRLLQIWEDDWRLRRPLVEERLRQELFTSTRPKEHARNMRVVEVGAAEAREFLKENHIQGFVNSSVYLSLQNREGKIMALASFKRQGEDYSLTRYATSATVRGGHSKLVAHFERTFTYRNLITFADLTTSVGGLYHSTGWIVDRILPPDYTYLVQNTRKHKFGYRIQKFREDPSLKFEEGMTERQLAELNGLHRVYDAGKIRFIKPHPSDTRMKLIELKGAQA